MNDNHKKTLLPSLLAFALVCGSSARAQQVRVLSGEVEERRGGSFSGLSIGMKVVGDVLKEAKRVRLVVEKAVDDSGKDLIDPEKTKTDFVELRTSGDNNVALGLALRTPARQATVVREVSGYVEIFVPAKDPGSVIPVANFLAGAGKPVASPALKGAGIELTVWTKEQYEARKKVEEERLRKEREEKRKKGEAEPFEELGEAVLGVMVNIFGGMFGGGLEEMGEYGIAIRINDPGSKLMDIEFEDGKGKQIGYKRMSSGGALLSELQKGEKTASYDFLEKLPDAAGLKLFILTQGSVVKVPFKLTSVSLP